MLFIGVIQLLFICILGRVHVRVQNVNATARIMKWTHRFCERTRSFAFILRSQLSVHCSQKINSKNRHFSTSKARQRIESESHDKFEKYTVKKTCWKRSGTSLFSILLVLYIFDFCVCKANTRFLKTMNTNATLVVNAIANIRKRVNASNYVYMDCSNLWNIIFLR